MRRALFRPVLLLATCAALAGVGVVANTLAADTLATGATLGSRPTSAASASAHRPRCGSRPRRRASSAAAGSSWDAGWGVGWGWRAGPPFAFARRASSHRGSRHCAARRGVHPRHGVSGEAPSSAGPGQGSPGAGTGSGTTSGGGLPETSTPAGGTPGGEAPAPPSIPHVQVTAVEWHFTLSRTTVPAGKVALEFVNSGEDEHNLNALSDEGTLSGSFPKTVPHGVRDQTLEFRHGTYTLFCSLEGHEAKGMRATLTVE